MYSSRSGWACEHQRSFELGVCKELIAVHLNVRHVVEVQAEKIGGEDELSIVPDGEGASEGYVVEVLGLVGIGNLLVWNGA